MQLIWTSTRKKSQIQPYCNLPNYINSEICVSENKLFFSCPIIVYF